MNNMIVQITRTKNESFLIKEMLPIWQRYADGFVFYDDGSTDDTVEFLDNNKAKYNILAILKREKEEDQAKELKIESIERQRLYDEAIKYTSKIICCDSDEYLDGSISKQNFEQFLDVNPNTLFNLRWTQYTSKDTIRIDGQWRMNFKVRAGNYMERGDYGIVQMHSLHLPPTEKSITINPDAIFIAHLQWLDKRWVGVKQYFWKVNDYISKNIHGAKTFSPADYDASVSNFEWIYERAPLPLRVRDDIYKSQDMKQNYKLEFIKKYTKLYNIPNLGDWGMGIHDYCLK